ncbi:MAG: ChbG/HpnK family deacetylase [Cyclobacteriaceae bacterium]
MKYIFTADDFGVSPIIDDAIGEAVSKGCINSIADLANGFDRKGFSAVLQLKKLKEAHPHIQVGLHYTLTSGRAFSGRYFEGLDFLCHPCKPDWCKSLAAFNLAFIKSNSYEIPAVCSMSITVPASCCCAM